MLARMVGFIYGRNPFLEAVPWLMLASALRFVAFVGGFGALIVLIFVNLAIFLAFLLAARRMIEWTGGSVQFGHWPLRDQLRVGQQILNRMLLLLFGMAVAVSLFGFGSFAPHLLKGFDGIAFDQFTNAGRFWSAFLAALVYLMLIDAEQHGKPSLLRTMRTLLLMWRWALPAIVLVAFAHIALAVVQGQARYLLGVVWLAPGAPQTVMGVVYFVFVFGFAAIRLWVTLAILTIGLREGYRRMPAWSARQIADRGTGSQRR